MFIYKITNKIDNKTYVGQTTRTIEKRWKEHKRVSLIDSPSTNSYFYNALRKWGFDNFEIEVITTASSIDELNYLEKFHIENNKSLYPHGYNISTGGDNYTRARGPMEGKRHSESTKRKMSNSSKGVSKSAEHCVKIGLSKKGKRRSESTKKKHSLSMMGKVRYSLTVYCPELSKTFSSVSEAVRQLKIPRKTIDRLIESKKVSPKHQLSFVIVKKEANNE